MYEVELEYLKYPIRSRRSSKYQKLLFHPNCACHILSVVVLTTCALNATVVEIRSKDNYTAPNIPKNPREYEAT